MNLHPIVTPNTKGQLVIPAAIRKSLHITPSTPLEIQAVGNHIVLKPIKSITTADTTKNHYLEVLKLTAGSWANDDWPKTEKKRRKTELEASERNKKAQW